MKKLTAVTLSLFFIMGLAHHLSANTFKIGGFLSYYAVSDSVFKEVYEDGGLMFGGSLSFDVIKEFEIRVEANYFQNKGQMTLTKEETYFSIVPLVLGARIKLLDRKISPYVGSGVDYCLYKEELPERFEQVSETVVGFHVEAGVYVNVLKSLFLDLNFRYIQADAKPFDETIKLGGWRAGLGIGFQF
ncbi:MAG: outer membrane beta-barrel protein [Candidatus Aminicenantaceae bacterium]